MVFIRCFIDDGDTTTVGGTVCAVPQLYPTTRGDEQKHACYEGDPVKCPACNSIGVARCVPPFRSSTGPDGRQMSLDGDLCICRCAVPPRLIASRLTNSMSFSADEIARMPGASGWLSYAGHTQAVTRYDEFFAVHDKATGQPVSGFSYGLQTNTGEHHGELDEDGATAKAYADDAQTVTLTYLVQTRIGIRP